jgi:hypothetical protein
MMTHSESLAEIGKALCAAQREIEHAAKDRTNPAFRQSYATLASVDDACRPALSRHGIAIVSAPSFDADARIVTVETRLIHTSGEWLAASCSSPVAKADAQGIGSAITYLRRYTLSALAGVAPGDDDDGNAATGRAAPAERKAPRPAAEASAQRSDDYQRRLDDTVTRLRALGWYERAAEKHGAPPWDHALLTTIRDAIKAEEAKRADGGGK